ncbi:MAG: hypothetical protein JST06_07670 [Bacteroidetes bacterium]|nr:hypothetical protein [Bacteroidota bacterium]
MNKLKMLLFLLAFMPGSLFAQTRNNDSLLRIYFNLYTDSIKTALDFYLNVEGEYQDGKILPLDTSELVFQADQGRIRGNSWRAPQQINFQKVRFTVNAKGRPELQDSTTVWLKKFKDPRDEQ